jgi:hypothetical protein
MGVQGQPQGGAELPVWVVYDKPADFPNTFVARRWLSAAGPKVTPTDDFIVSPDLESLRALLASRGLVRFNRSPEDDAKIVEVWI